MQFVVTKHEPNCAEKKRDQNHELKEKTKLRIVSIGILLVCPFSVIMLWAKTDHIVMRECHYHFDSCQLWKNQVDGRQHGFSTFLYTHFQSTFSQLLKWQILSGITIHKVDCCEWTTIHVNRTEPRKITAKTIKMIISEIYLYTRRVEERRCYSTLYWTLLLFVNIIYLNFSFSATCHGHGRPLSHLIHKRTSWFRDSIRIYNFKKWMRQK